MRILVNPGEGPLMVDTRRQSVELRPFSRRQAANNLCFAVVDNTDPKSDAGRTIESNVQRRYLREATPQEIIGLRACNIYSATKDGMVEQLDRRAFEISDTVSLGYLKNKFPKMFESQEPAKPPTGTGDKDREVAGAGGNRGNR